MNLIPFTRQLAESIVLNINEMLPKKMLIENNVKKLILTGQATKPHFKCFIEKFYADMQIVSTDDGVADAALGCALFGCDYLKFVKL